VRASQSAASLSQILTCWLLQPCKATHDLLDPSRLGVRGLPDGPAKHCPACAGNASGASAVKTPVLCTWDGWFKPKVHSGRKIDDSPAVIKEFVGAVHASVQAAEAPGVVQEREDETYKTCSSEFKSVHAARPLQENKLLNVVVGAVCVHLMPLCQLFVLSRRGGARAGLTCFRAHTARASDL
jgi:hypothetical protein